MSKTEYPRIHLVLDNCFAVKRWVEPKDWMYIINQIGGITNEWVNEVLKYGDKYGFDVVSFYSGYAEYRTVGLASS